MTREARRKHILAKIQNDGAVEIPDLAGDLAVSEMTIRRDLDLLAEEGRAIRTRGGATGSGRVSFEFSFLQRERSHAVEKRAIGRTAAAIVKDGQSVLLDSGTTTLAVARALLGRRNLTVITTSLPIASALQYDANISVLLLGGFRRQGSPDLSGGLTEQNLEQLRCDMAILGTDAVAANGSVYSNSVDVASLLTRMASSARDVYVVADSSKLGCNGLMRFGNLSAWNGLITDSHIDPVLRDELATAGARVIRAEDSQTRVVP